MTNAKPLDPAVCAEVVASDRWASKVKPRADGCLEWTAGRTALGYGTIGVAGRRVMAHRVAWVAFHAQDVPAGLELDHWACSRRACVNPRHLRPVSHRENVLRGTSFATDQRARTHCPRGHELEDGNVHPSKKARGGRQCATCTRVWAAEQARAVRAAVGALGMTHRQYRAIYGSSQATAEAITNIMTTHIPEDWDDE